VIIVLHHISNFQLYHDENKLQFDEMMMMMMMMSGLFWTNTLSCMLIIVLAHWNNSPRVDMLLQSDILFWFQANQSLLLLI